MATTNHERVGKALELLRDGLGPFIQREFKAQHGQYWVTTVTAGWRDEAPWPEDADAPRLDVALLLRISLRTSSWPSSSLTGIAIESITCAALSIGSRTSA